MCFYDQHRFTCGDWKWGHFRQHCAKEYRIGETCGMKLIMQTVPTGTKCKLREKIETKMRRRAAEVDRIGRWQREPLKFTTAIEKAVDMIRALDGEIYELGCERSRRLQYIEANPQQYVLVPEATPVVAPTHGINCPGIATNAKYEMIARKAILSGLPITFETASGPATVMAVPDSGSDQNVISLDLAQHLGFKVHHDAQGKLLRLIDGSIISTTGTIQARCRFGKTFYAEPRGFDCIFRVLSSLVSPLIMSAAFLEYTETWTKHRNRLVTLSLLSLHIPRIFAMGGTHSRLHCTIDGQHIEALADSGSDVDVMSLAYATQRGFKICETQQEVVLADGRRKSVCGTYVAQISVGKNGIMLPIPLSSARDDDSGGESLPNQTTKLETGEKAAIDEKIGENVRHVIRSTFYVLDGITLSVLVGGASIESLKILSHHGGELFELSESDVETPELHRISLATKTRNGSSQVMTGPISPPRIAGRASLTEQINEADQRENARREVAQSTSSTLNGEEKAMFDAEEEIRRRGYDEYRAQLIQAYLRG